jgi:chromosome segregation ATPase
MEYLSASSITHNADTRGTASLQNAMNEILGGGQQLPSSFGLDELHDSNPASKSFQSAIFAASATGSASSSSKAVLAALKALQEKIRRLETERSQALDEVTQLRIQLKNQEIEAEHQKQRENLSNQKNIQEMKNIQDKLFQEKIELESKLQRFEEKIHNTQITSEELTIKIRSLEEEKHQNGLKLKELEHQQTQLEQQLKIAELKEKGN